MARLFDSHAPRMGDEVLVSQRNSPPRASWSIAWLLPLLLGVLILAAVAPVIAIGAIGARDLSARMLRERNDLLIEAVVTPIEALLDPVATQMGEAMRLVANATVDVDDERAFEAFVRGLMAPTPQVHGMALLSTDGRLRRWAREGTADALQSAEHLNVKQHYLDEAAEGAGPRWSRPFQSALGKAIVTYRVPLWTGGRLSGVLLASVSVQRLSASLVMIGREFNLVPFVLVDRTGIVAHPGIPAVQKAVVTSSNLPTIDTVGDPVLAAIWADPRPFGAVEPLRSAEGHWTWVGNGAHQFVFRQLRLDGDGTWLVGFHHPSALTRYARWMSYGVAAVGTLLLILALVAAVRIGRGLARPMVAFGQASNAIERFDFHGTAIDKWERSRIREVASTALAIRRMAKALATFERYVPRTLVRNLVLLGDRAGGAQRRELTIMFLDLEGYTRFAEERPAQEVSDYLNEMFRLVGPVIEESGGTIDKYTGDGLMAFWGAPAPDPDHARNAVDAAFRLRTQLSASGKARREAGLPTCRVRIGLNTGEVVVGDLGYLGRTNYTVVGHAVNAAKRTEESLRGVGREHPVAVAMTEAVIRTARLSRQNYAFEPLDGRTSFLVTPAGSEHGRCRGCTPCGPAAPE
jgi:adenylate cyclase